VEPSCWLNIVIQHPESLYGADPARQGTPEDEESVDGETIANAKFQLSTFREEDSKILHLVVEQFYSYLQMFHGNVQEVVKKHRDDDTLSVFRDQMTDFTSNFIKYFFNQEYSPNYFWNLCFQGFFYCPIDKNSFL